MKVNSSSVVADIPKLITKTSYKLLDNDVKTAWINPRLISKMDLEMIKATEFIPATTTPSSVLLHPVVGIGASSSSSSSSLSTSIERNMNGHFSHNLSHQNQICGRVYGKEWESSVNGRAKLQVSVAASAVPASTQAAADAKRRRTRMDSSHHYHHPSTSIVTKKYRNQRSPKDQRVKGVVGFQSSCYVGGDVHDSAVYGVYAETKYTFAVNGLPRSVAQASTAAAFFARAAQKLNLSSSPYRRKRYDDDGGGGGSGGGCGGVLSEDCSNGFCGVLQKTPPPVPPALLRRIGVREVTGVGKVKVMLKVSNPTSSTELTSSNGFFSLDKRKKQVTLIDPTACGGTSSAPEDRRVGVAAPKMFAFDAIFSQDDSQTEVCSSALTDVIHAVINGTDGCLFCFGHAGLGKSYTMLGTPETANTLGIIPCAISWLFKGINEQKQKTGARFSVRVSAVEVCGPSNSIRDLLSGYANDSEQSPGVYLRDDPLFVNQPPHCELRVPTAEKAAHYLDAAIECRTPAREDTRDSHLLFTLHVYQYSVAGKGGVAGGRSRLHLIDLGNSDRSKASGGIPLSGVGNVLLAIFNGQKHLPYKEHKLTQLLKDCLSSLTCHTAMIAHVSPYAQNYSDTLTTVQLASRIHRMRRRRIKFVSSGTGNGSGGSSGEELMKTTGTSSEPDPSSSDLSADTVIYVGPADDATDGEHPPVYIPSLNSGDNRCSMSKVLRGSIAEQQRPKATTTPQKINQQQQQLQQLQQQQQQQQQQNRLIGGKPSNQNNKTTLSAHSSPKSSPSRLPTKTTKSETVIKHVVSGGSDEQWIDGPRISKSKVAEARYLMKEPCHVKKRETWIDGPMQVDNSTTSYGYMDSHKKNMIRKWVEHQTTQIQKNNKHHIKETKSHNKEKESLKELTQFKTFDDDQVIKPLDTKKVEIVEESVIRTGLKLNTIKSNTIPECKTPEENDNIEPDEEDEEAVEIPPALPLIQPLSSREVSLESLDILLKERMLSNAEYNNYQNNYDKNSNEDDQVLEIIEVEEPLEPVPTQDCCLQVTEEDIALCMGYRENPLPEVDQENPLDHPLRILSQENLTIVSTFTDSMSVYTDLERILPRNKFSRYLNNDDYEDIDNPCRDNGNLDETTRKKFDQLAKLHELYSNRLAKANVANSETYQSQKANQKILSRCESFSLSNMIYGEGEINNIPDNSSIYSEPAYVQEKFCENCKINMTRPMTTQNWFPDQYLSTSTQDLTIKSPNYCQLGGRFQRYCHNNYNDHNLANLRHPDGASNPNLKEENFLLSKPLSQTLPPPNSLPSVERINRAILSIESGVTAIKLTQKSEGYDSGHDSTPRTSKHSPAAISRRAESGYDSVVRDSESSSIDSDTSRLSHNLRRGKCKHKHEKSFCSWFLNPFTCKYIEDPPETHF